MHMHMHMYMFNPQERQGHKEGAVQDGLAIREL
jgi:hypothetical protein